MAKQGSIRHYRQAGATKAPAALGYGELAVAKDGTVYAGNEQDKPVALAVASHTHTKAQVGLGNVDNTADSAKSVKYATSAGSAVDQTARNAAAGAQSTANSANTAAANANSNANGRMPYGGGDFTGNISVPTAYGYARLVRNNQVLSAGWGDTGHNTNVIYFIRK